tara:strand:- start:588 stop:878 length:291 start_codon:yes stop_codon:yes gene_type:complete
MAVYSLSSKSETDLAEIYEYGISNFGLLKARNYFQELHEVFDLLANNNDLGRDASEFTLHLKRFTFKAHTIFYLSLENGIFIVRVLSQRMDYENQL